MLISFLVAPTLFVATAASALPEPTPAAARRLIERYYAAIERGDFRSAYAAWDRGGQASGKSYAAFRRGFAETAHTRVVTGAATASDAGMSQRWIVIPVDVYAILKNGRHQHFRGSYTLHRVATGVGAAPAEMLWHISSAKLTAAR